MLRVGLAGGVHVAVDVRPVDEGSLGGRQGRRLLARLAWEGRAVHRDELADGIWAESLPRTWERTLSGVITRLRAGLRAAGVQGEIISYVDGRYCLVGGGGLQVDVRIAEVDLVGARTAVQELDLVRARAQVEAVLDIARLPLLPGEDAAWVDVARARHRELLLEALDVLGDVGLSGGWPELAEAAGREAVYCEPLREAGHQRLMRALAAKGDHGAVLTAYSTCRRVLAEELGVGPSPETEAIYREVLGAEPGANESDASGRPASSPARLPFPTTLGAHATVLVGREAALVWLWSLWRRARPDIPLTVVLRGPPGAGKRSLAAVFAREVHAAGATVVHWRAGRDDPGGIDLTGLQGTAAPLCVLELGEDGQVVPQVRGAALVLLVATSVTSDVAAEAALVVPPLDRASVAAVVEERLGRLPRDDELDELCGTTGGWPGALAEKLSEWAEARAGELAREAARSTASLTSAQAELADEILRRRSRSAASPPPPAGASPYKGLLRFEPEDADLFFGREQLVAGVLARMSTDGLVAILGASGSGKSSIMRAGVIAELRRGALPGSRAWPLVLLTPGRNPAAALTACLRSATGLSASADLDELFDELHRISPSVVVVDQFEEVFTLATSEEECVDFVAALLRGISEGTNGHRVLIALRSDFYDACAALAGLSDLVAASHVVVPPPTELELRRIVYCPARALGGVLEPGLIEEVIADASAAPGALPLVSTALLGSWARRTGSMVTIDAYRAAGGVAGAITTLAEDVWTSLDAAQQRLVRSMLVRLSGGEAGDLSNPVRRDELTSTDDAVAAGVLDRLVRHRLVTVDDDTVRLAHEALVREWPRLRGWLAEARATREGLDHLRRTSADWRRRGRDPADLYRGTRLASALELDSTVQLSAAERQFLDASADQQRTELHDLRSRSRRLRALTGVLLVLLVVAAVAGVTAVVRQREAADQARVAVAQRLAREAESASGLDLRLLLAAQARRLDDTAEARGALLTQMTRASAVTGFLQVGTGSISAAALNLDGTLLATGGADGSVTVLRLPDGERLATAALIDGPVTALAFSSGSELSAGSNGGGVVRWDPGETDPARAEVHTQATLAVAYRPDGSLATAGRDGLLRIFRLSTGAVLSSMSITSGAVAGSFDRDGSTYAQIGGDGGLRVIDVDRGAATVPVSPFTPADEVTALALSADGSMLALGTRLGDVGVVHLDTGATVPLGRLTGASRSSGSPGAVERLAFTGAGQVLAAVGGAIGQFDVDGGREADVIELAGGRVTGLTVDPTGATAVAVTETGAAALLELERSTLARRLGNVGRSVTALTADRNGTIAVAGEDQVVLLDPVTGRRQVLPTPGRPVTSVSSNGVLLATGGRNVFRGGGGPHGVYTVVEIDSGQLLVDRTSFSAEVTAVALDVDGERLAFGDERGSVRLLEPATGRRLHDLRLPAAAAGLVFARGAELVAVAVDGTIARWDARARPIGDLVSLDSPASALALAPDGASIAVATADGVVIVDLATGRVGRPLASPFGSVESVSFGLDGTVLATGGTGGVLLWDVASMRPLGDPLPGTRNSTVAFDATGDNLITGGADGTVTVWEADPGRWVEIACAIAGRTLTRDEWRHYLGERAYDPACP